MASDAPFYWIFNWFDQLWDFISYECWYHISLSYSILDECPHQNCILEVGHIGVSLGTNRSSVCHKGCDLWVGYSHQCLIKNIRLAYIAVRPTEISFQSLHGLETFSSLLGWDIRCSLPDQYIELAVNINFGVPTRCLIVSILFRLGGQSFILLSISLLHTPL